MDYSDLDNRFSYHKPNEATGEKHQDVRQMCLSLAEDLNGLLPEGREKSLAITHLEEVMFWANADIARSNPLD
jgi:hypothetical protein